MDVVCWKGQKGKRSDEGDEDCEKRPAGDSIGKVALAVAGASMDDHGQSTDLVHDWLREGLTHDEEG